MDLHKYIHLNLFSALINLVHFVVIKCVSLISCLCVMCTDEIIQLGLGRVIMSELISSDISLLHHSLAHYRLEICQIVRLLSV